MPWRSKTWLVCATVLLLGSAGTAAQQGAPVGKYGKYGVRSLLLACWVTNTEDLTPCDILAMGGRYWSDGTSKGAGSRRSAAAG